MLEHRPPFVGLYDLTYKIHVRTPLDELSARRKDLYLLRTTQYKNTRAKHPCPREGFKPATPATERPQSYALDTATPATERPQIYALDTATTGIGI
jgi:hypothetical protein